MKTIIQERKEDSNFFVGLVFVFFKSNVTISFLFQAMMSFVTVQQPVQITPHAVKPKRALGLAVP